MDKSGVLGLVALPWDLAFKMPRKNNGMRAAPFPSEGSYARGFVGVLLQAVKYRFGSILPVQDQIHWGLPSLIKMQEEM